MEHQMDTEEKLTQARSLQERDTDWLTTTT